MTRWLPVPGCGPWIRQDSPKAEGGEPTTNKARNPLESFAHARTKLRGHHPCLQVPWLQDATSARRLNGNDLFASRFANTSRLTQDHYRIIGGKGMIRKSTMVQRTSKNPYAAYFVHLVHSGPTLIRLWLSIWQGRVELNVWLQHAPFRTPSCSACLLCLVVPCFLFIDQI